MPVNLAEFIRVKERLELRVQMLERKIAALEAAVAALQAERTAS